MRKSIYILASCVMLTSCGGGGGSISGSPTPTPSATVTPTPTPSASPLATGEVKPSSDATFISASMDLTTTGGVSQTQGVITGGMTSNRVTTFDTPQFMASYNAGYSLSDAVNAASFGRSQLSADTTTTNGNGVVFFTNISAAAENYLALYQETTFSSSIKGSGYTTARYGGTGGWQHTVVNSSSRNTRLDYFAYGSATPVSAMPHSGIVRFSLLGSGNYATDTDLWFLTSGSSNFLTVDFGAGTISGSAGLAGQNFFKSQVGGIGSLPLSGTFTGNSMTGSITNGSLGVLSGVPGRFHLMFVGPAANEVVITFVASDATQAVVGAFVGVIDPYA